MKSKRKVLLALTITQRAYYRGVVRYAREHNWHLVMDMVYTGRVPLGWRGDGILTILGYRRELADFIRSAGVPAVAITLVNERIPLPRIEGDNVRIGQLAAEHFLERGFRHFAWAPFLNDVMDAERYEGFSRTLAEQGFACTVLPPAHALTGRVWQEDWAERRRRLIAQLKKLPRPTAILGYNDCVAADLIDACRDAGLLVPEEMAVLGVDNDPAVTPSTRTRLPKGNGLYDQRIRRADAPSAREEAPRRIRGENRGHCASDRFYAPQPSVPRVPVPLPHQSQEAPASSTPQRESAVGPVH